MYESDISLQLYTKKNPKVPIKLNNDSYNLLENKTTVFILHGYGGSALNEWVIDMKNAYLIKGDYQIIAIDYSPIGHFNYFKALKALPLAGKFIKLMSKLLSF